MHAQALLAVALQLSVIIRHYHNYEGFITETSTEFLSPRHADEGYS